MSEGDAVEPRTACGQLVFRLFAGTALPRRMYPIALGRGKQKREMNSTRGGKKVGLGHNMCVCVCVCFLASFCAAFVTFSEG